MKKTVIGSLLLLAVLSGAIPVRAANWTNGAYSCDITVMSNNWWNSLFSEEFGTHDNVKFYLNAQPQKQVTYACQTAPGDTLLCIAPSQDIYALGYRPVIKVPWKSGSSSEECGSVFAEAFRK